MKIVTIVGARPQFIKASAISAEIKRYNARSSKVISETIIHTGQHFDKNMSDDFFMELSVPKPRYNLKVANLSHGAMTGRMLEKLESKLVYEKPDLLLVYGDTNSTLAGALAAVKVKIPIAHIEAGLRSFNMEMPEEINRILTDRVSDYLFCPTQTAVVNLNNEGIRKGVYNVGDVMYDVTLKYRAKAKREIKLSMFGVSRKNYVLLTLHRNENTVDINRISNIFDAMREVAKQTKVLFPIHPRTKKLIEDSRHSCMLKGIDVLEPQTYLKMLRLEMDAKVIFTDSGGVQKEAFFHKVPCITLRDETEWLETLVGDRNVTVGSSKSRILAAWERASQQVYEGNKIYPYGEGKSAKKILDKLVN